MKRLNASFIACVAILGSTTSESFAQEWETVWESSPSPRWISDIEFANERVGWAILAADPGGGHGVLRTTNGGETWRTAWRGPTISISVKSFGPDSAWVVGDDVALWTIDGGVSWHRQILGMPSLRRGEQPYGLWDIDCVDSGHCLAVGTAVARTTDGANWRVADKQPLATPAHFLSVSMISRDTAWIAGGAGIDDGYLFRTVDGGETWEERDVGVVHRWLQVHFFDGLKGYLLGTQDAFLVTEDGGQTWDVRRERGVARRVGLRQASFFDQDTGWLVGLNGVTQYTTDAMVTWTDMREVIFEEHHESVYFVSPDLGWVGGGGSRGTETHGAFIKKLIGGCSMLAVCMSAEFDEIPAHRLEMGAHPNPFSGYATIEFNLDGLSRVELQVFDVLGRMVATLANEHLPPGQHARTFESKGLPAGQYYYRLTTESGTSGGGLVLAR